MFDGDLYVQDGETYTNGVYYPETPAEVTAEEQERKGKIASSYPVMDDVADWFKDQIKLTDSAQYIKSYAKAEGVTLDEAHRGFDIARILLETKAQEFAEFGKEVGDDRD